MNRVLRHSWLRSAGSLRIALLLLIVLLGVGGYVLTSKTIRDDRDASAERSAQVETVQTQEVLGRARAYVEGFGEVLAAESRPGQPRFARLAGATAASVGLNDVLWVQQVPHSERRRYERRHGASITRLTGSGFERAPRAGSYLPAAFTSRTRPELRPGVDVSSFPGLPAAIRNRATVFAVSASGPGSLGAEPGFFLLETARFGRGPDSRGFLVAFVPRGWFATTLGGDPRRVAISQDGRRIEGELSSADAAASFDVLGHRWRIDVGREPPSGLQSTLPWIALVWPLAVALIVLLVWRAIMLRRRAERDVERIFDLSADLLATIGFDGYYKSVNPSFERTLGYSKQELVSRPWSDFVHPDDLQSSREAFAGVVDGKEVVGFENRFVRADGSEILLEWNARAVPGESVIYGIARDVTESRRAQREFEEIFTLSPDLLGISDLDGNLKRVNPAFEEAFGYSSEELLLQPLLDLGHPEDRAAAADAFAQLARGQEVPRFENRNIRADGSILWLEWSSRTLPEEGVIYGAARDITDRKRSEEQLRQAQENVETSRAKLAVYAEDQAALRRVATLVARGASPTEVLDAVAAEVSGLLSTDITSLLRFEPDDTATVLAIRDEIGLRTPVGTRITLEGEPGVVAMLRTGRPARMEDHAVTPGSMAARLRELGLRTGVGAPITVEGRIWGGVLTAWAQDEPPLADPESRIAEFTELVGTAIANAESRAEVTRLLEEQAALRRVATLVARGVSPVEVFGAVTAETAQLLGADTTSMLRYEPGGTAVVVAADGKPGLEITVGARLTLEGESATAAVFRTGRTIWTDVIEGPPESVGALGHGLGMQTALGAPVVVEGRLWGTIIAAWTRQEPKSADIEARMTQFSGLAATAIANAESRAEVSVHVEEQAALRRVATLVARAVPRSEIFTAVAEEVRRLFSADVAAVARFEAGGPVAVVLGVAQDAAAVPIATRWELDDYLATTEVFRTGRSARLDDEDPGAASGPNADELHRMGKRSTVSSPIIVEGRLWGVIAVSTRHDPLRPDAEERMTSFTELVGTAIANAEGRAELTASRARVVAATAEERRRVVRDLHDGAQQRLVHAVIMLKLAIRGLDSGDKRAEEFVSEALDHAEQANSELRELVHGILPGVLTSGGLHAGVEELASRSSLPVTVDVSPQRFPPAIEATAYFVVSEALTNTLKHARAQRAEVGAHAENGVLRVEVHDDGVGGADPGRGSGLTGLRDRVEALGGTIGITSPAGGGTSLCVEIPIEGGRPR